MERRRHDDPFAALDLAALPEAEMPASARAMARFSLFDRIVCGRAGVGEPLAGILRDYVAAEGGRRVASIFGGGQAPARAGFTSADDGVMGPQGFVATHSDAPSEAGVWDAPPPGPLCSRLSNTSCTPAVTAPTR